jgi:hypothetical protein
MRPIIFCGMSFMVDGASFSSLPMPMLIIPHSCFVQHERPGAELDIQCGYFEP